MDVHSLISRLSDGEFHSGSELGAYFGVSRAAVWKALGRLNEYDLEVESVKGRGYRLAGGVHLLDSKVLVAALPDDLRARIDLEVLLSVGSTNQHVMSNFESSSAYRVVLAERQTQGRGRRGRAWVSPFAKNIYMSVGFELQGGVEALGGLSLVVGLAVVRAVKACSKLDAQLKWPNDVWVDGKKAAGILVELQGEATTGWRVVVGLGVNVDMQPRDGSQIDQPWIAIGESLSCSRSEFAATVLQCLVEVLDEFQLNGLAAFIDEWRRSDLLHGRKVLVSGSELSGVAVGIDSGGALIVDTGDELKTVCAGEVSVRPDEA